MAILTEYSLWLSLICILTGVSFSLLLYYKNRKIDFGKKNLKLLYLLRGLSISLITFLLLAPITKMTIKKVEKPILLLAVDHSESIVAGSDSVYYKNEFSKQLEQLISSFGNKYEVQLFRIGQFSKKVDQFDYQFTDKTTQISDLVDEINTIYSNRNVGALVLASDGVINKGQNPIYKLEHSRFPVYTIGMGNPSVQTDLLISNVVHNSQTYKGNNFPVEIKISAHNLKGNKPKLTIYQNENEVFSTNLSIQSQSYYTTVKTHFQAQSKGIQKYKVVLSHLDGELTYRNNTTTFYMEVVDQREKMAIIYNAPHPDIAAIKSALEMSDNYQIDLISIDEYKGSLPSYSLVILHQIPSIQNPAQNLLHEIQKSKISALYILGPKTNMTLFNSLKSGLAINKNKELTNESFPFFNSNFVSFTFSEDAKLMLSKFPPLLTPFGDYQEAAGSNVLFYQKIAGVNTNIPLFSFSDFLGSKSAVLVGSGIWQWKLYNYMYAENHDVFNEIINKTALYLSVTGDKSQFRVTSKNIYDENGSIDFQAELFNDSYELITHSDVNMVVQSSSGKKYSYQFSKQDHDYILNLGSLPVDDYSWIASTESGNQKFSKSGTFSVKEMMVETQNLVADHQLLKRLSENTNGTFFTVEQLNQVENEIKSNETIKPIATYDKSYQLILNSATYLLLILIVLAIEWFIRKWNGSY
ncbi:MAG TPA: hypothetical protein PLI77_01390 [Bacteroidales bacterium]|nr:hypothetical protein [Bacteroidales bacterium]